MERLTMKEGIKILTERYEDQCAHFPRHRAYLSAMFLQSICRDIRSAINGVMP